NFTRCCISIIINILPWSGVSALLAESEYYRHSCCSVDIYLFLGSPSYWRWQYADINPDSVQRFSYSICIFCFWNNFLSYRNYSNCSKYINRQRQCSSIQYFLSRNFNYGDNRVGDICET